MRLVFLYKENVLSALKNKKIEYGNMKRLGNVFDDICDIKNLRIAFYKAAKGRHNRKSVQKIEKNLDNKLLELHNMLLEGRFHTSEYHMKKVYEPKERDIYILPFWPDRVVQHAILNILEPYWEKIFISDTYSCIRGKGQHKGSERTLYFTERYQYVYKADIHHFYPSLNHQILKDIIRKKIKDKRLLVVLDDIIDSVPGEVNVPIGNLISQWFGNLYLNELDMFVKQNLHCKAYIRYCDDFLLFSNDKPQLQQWKKECENFITEQLLLVFSKSRIFPTASGVDFLGYRHYPEGYILVRKSTAQRLKRKLNYVYKGVQDKTIDPEYAEGFVESMYGWISGADSYNLMQSLNFEEIRKNIKDYAQFFRNSEGRTNK